MRGVILAGGTGSRLGQLTKTLNKHVLPVYDRPMICWPLKTLTDNGIDDITIVSTPSGVGQIAAILGSGKSYGCELTYKVQEEAKGIADALRIGYGEEKNGQVAVILGDNVFLPSPMNLTDFILSDQARAYIHPQDNERLKALGVARFKNGEIESIIEKPAFPPSDFAVVGLYVFGSRISDVVKLSEPSERGEMEITDVLNQYATRELLLYTSLTGYWGDAGTFEGLIECSNACKRWSEKWS